MISNRSGTPRANFHLALKKLLPGLKIFTGAIQGLYSPVALKLHSLDGVLKTYTTFFLIISDMDLSQEAMDLSW